MNRFIYTALLYLVLPLVPLKLYWRGFKQPEYRRHWAERFGFYSFKLMQPVIWLHCVSVGETRAAEPLVRALLQEYTDHQILITHGTPTGRETSKSLFADMSLPNNALRDHALLGNKVHSVYLPYDLPIFVRRFFNHFKPNIGVILETELWFNVLATAKQCNVSMLLVNARLSEKSAAGYARLGKLTEQAIQNIKFIAAQTEQDAGRFKRLGANNVAVLGNIKFDLTPPADKQMLGEQLRACIQALNKIGNPAIFLAASTREGEEIIILDAIKDLNMMTIIVPRHPQRFEAVATLLQSRELKFLRRSELKTSNVPKLLDANVRDIQDKVQIILGDSMGEMYSYYAACDFALIGGSLLPYGSQNLIEAMASGKPVLVGEHTFNFKQVAEIAVAKCAAWRVKDAAEIKQAIQTLIADPHKQLEMGAVGVSLCKASTGATEKTMKLIRPYLLSR